MVEKIRGLKPGEGLDADTGDYGDLIKAGVIDPTMVTRSALQNAASIAQEHPHHGGDRRRAAREGRRRDARRRHARHGRDDVRGFSPKAHVRAAKPPADVADVIVSTGECFDEGPGVGPGLFGSGPTRAPRLGPHALDHLAVAPATPPGGKAPRRLKSALGSITRRSAASRSTGIGPASVTRGRAASTVHGRELGKKTWRPVGRASRPGGQVAALDREVVAVRLDRLAAAAGIRADGRTRSPRRAAQTTSPLRLHASSASCIRCAASRATSTSAGARSRMPGPRPGHRSKWRVALAGQGDVVIGRPRRSTSLRIS